MPISTDFTPILTVDFEINFLQCYPNGYLKHTDLCNIFQIVAGKHAEMGGISFSDMQKFNQAWVLSRMIVEIDRLPRWKENVTVKTWIKSLENSRSIRCLELYSGNEKIAGCETFWAVFNTDTRRPEPLALPHEHFKKYLDNATVRSFGKIELPTERQLVNRHTVKLSDLDIVNHVNSAKYVEWCLDELDYFFIEENKIKVLEMNYLRELASGDSAEIHRNDSENNLVYSIESQGKINFILNIDLK